MERKQEHQMARGWGRGRKDWAEVFLMPYVNKLTILLHLNGYTASYISNELVLSVKYGFAQHAQKY